MARLSPPPAPFSRVGVHHAAQGTNNQPRIVVGGGKRLHCAERNRPRRRDPPARTPVASYARHAFGSTGVHEDRTPAGALRDRRTPPRGRRLASSRPSPGGRAIVPSKPSDRSFSQSGSRLAAAAPKAPRARTPGCLSVGTNTIDSLDGASAGVPMYARRSQAWSWRKSDLGRRRLSRQPCEPHDVVVTPSRNKRALTFIDTTQAASTNRPLISATGTTPMKYATGSACGARARAGAA